MRWSVTSLSYEVLRITLKTEKVHTTTASANLLTNTKRDCTPVLDVAYHFVKFATGAQQQHQHPEKQSSDLASRNLLG